MLVLDQGEAIAPEDVRLLDQTAESKRIIVLNKTDLVARIDESLLTGTVARVSALTGDGFAELRRRMACELTGGEQLRDTAPISNTRHIALLEECRASLHAARNAADGENVPEEFLLIDLQAARLRLDEIVGRRTSEDVLRHIFERFCIGK